MKPPTLVRMLVPALALAAPLAAGAGPSLLVNGSFEDNAIAAGTWTVLPSLTGWQGTPNIELRHQVAGLAQDGLQFVELDSFGNSGMHQDVATSAGEHYTLSWFYSPRIGVPAASNPVQVYWNDELLVTNGGSGLGFDAHQWQLFTVDVVGSGLDRVRFLASGTSDSYGGSLDKVALVLAEPAAVPEPPVPALVLAALGLLGLIATRERRAR